jgi:hypothetical protein
VPHWSTGELIWAPSVLRVNASFYVMYYVIQHKTEMKQCVSVAVSHDPLGPFVDRTTEPFMCQLDIGGSIDPSYVRTEHNNLSSPLYLVWKNDGNCCRFKVQIWSSLLSQDGLRLLGKPSPLLTNDLPWEGILVEGPSMVRLPSPYSGYLLFYSSNSYATYAYAVGAALCQTALGPCHKTSYSPTLQYHDSAWGPGGTEFFWLGDQLWIVYHAWTAPDVPGNSAGASPARSLRIDPVIISGTASAPMIKVLGPSTTDVDSNRSC